MNFTADGLDGFGGVIGDLDAELFFESHDQFDRVEAVSAQIVDEGRVFHDLVFFNAEMLDNDLLHAVCDIAHVFCASFCLGRLSPRSAPTPLSRGVALICPKGRLG